MYKIKKGDFIIKYLLVIFLIFICSIIIYVLLFINSTLKITINKLYIDTEYKKLDYEFKIEICFAKEIKLLSIMVNKNRINKLNLKINNIQKSNSILNISKININKILSKIQRNLKQKIQSNSGDISKYLQTIYKNLKIDISQYKMNLKIGISDVLLNSIIIGIISIVIAFILRIMVSNTNKIYNYHYKILPIYGEKNVLKLNLNCIVSIKLVHIINIIYILYRKGRKDKYVRTSSKIVNEIY